MSHIMFTLPRHSLFHSRLETANTDVSKRIDEIIVYLQKINLHKIVDQQRLNALSLILRQNLLFLSARHNCFQ